MKELFKLTSSEEIGYAEYSAIKCSNGRQVRLSLEEPLEDAKDGEFVDVKVTAIIGNGAEYEGSLAPDTF